MTPYKRDIQVGDIHGCFSLLLKLLHAIQFAPPHDHLTFLGDYIDRGRDSSSVLMYLNELHEEHPDNITLLLGNHESLALDALIDGDDSEAALLWIINGGHATLKSFSSVSATADYLLPFLKKTNLYYETETHITVHAGLLPSVPLEEQPEKTLLWNRKFDAPHCSGKTVIVGHTIHDTVKRYPGYICIDTGAYANKTLSAYDILNDVIYQVTE